MLILIEIRVGCVNAIAETRSLFLETIWYKVILCHAAVERKVPIEKTLLIDDSDD